MADDPKKILRENNKFPFFTDYLQSLGMEPNAKNQYQYTQRGNDGEAHTQYQFSGKAHGHDLTVVFDLGNVPSGRYNVKAYVDGDAVTAPVAGEDRTSGYLGIIDPTPGIKHYLSPRGHETLALLEQMLGQPATTEPATNQAATTDATQPAEPANTQPTTKANATRPAQPVQPKQPAPKKPPAPVHNANPGNDASYVKECCDWLGSKTIEDTRKKSYYDSEDNITVGIGFNMDAPGAEKEWNTAFSALPAAQRPDFDRIYSGADLKKGEKPQADQLLNPQQIQTLAHETVRRREKKLEKAYGDTWTKLNDDQKTAISSAFFTNETNVVTNNRFFANMKAYGNAKTPAEQQKYLNFAAFELGFNTKSDPNRRRSEAEKLLGIYGQPDAGTKLDALKTDTWIVDYAKEHNIHISQATTSISDPMQAALAAYQDASHRVALDRKSLGIGAPVTPGTQGIT